MEPHQLHIRGTVDEDSHKVGNRPSIVLWSEPRINDLPISRGVTTGVGIGKLKRGSKSRPRWAGIAFRVDANSFYLTQARTRDFYYRSSIRTTAEDFRLTRGILQWVAPQAGDGEIFLPFDQPLMVRSNMGSRCDENSFPGVGVLSCKRCKRRARVCRSSAINTRYSTEINPWKSKRSIPGP